MSSAAPANGTTGRLPKLGVVSVDGTRIARITQFSINSEVGESAWGDSDSEGYTNRLPARADCTGSLQGKFDNDSPVYDLFAPGDIVQLDLFETNAAGDYWALPSALIKNFQLTYDQDSKEVVGWTADFGTDGKFYYPGQSGAPSRSYPT